MNQEEFQHQSKSANIQEKVKKFSKEKSTKIIAEIKKKVSSSKHSELSLPSQSDLGTIKSMVVFDPTIVLEKICERPSGLTEVRRDGKDNAAVIRVIKEEFKRCQEKKEMKMTDLELTSHMRYFASACWVSNLLLLYPIAMKGYKIIPLYRNEYSTIQNDSNLFVVNHGITSPSNVKRRNT